MASQPEQQHHRPAQLPGGTMCVTIAIQPYDGRVQNGGSQRSSWNVPELIASNPKADESSSCISACCQREQDNFEQPHYCSSKRRIQAMGAEDSTAYCVSHGAGSPDARRQPNSAASARGGPDDTREPRQVRRRTLNFGTDLRLVSALVYAGCKDNAL